jgi:hypothetical protein
MGHHDASGSEYFFRCCLCHKDEDPGLKTAQFMRLDCEKHGATLHQKWVKRADGSIEPVA